MHDPTVQPARRDEMARAAAPFIHPRLSSVEARMELVGHEKALDELEGPPIVDAITASEDKPVAANGHDAGQSEESPAAHVDNFPHDDASEVLTAPSSPVVPPHVLQ